MPVDYEGREPLYRPHEVRWYHGSDSMLSPGQFLNSEENYFTHDPERASSYGEHLYEVKPPKDTRRWDVAHAVLESDYWPEDEEYDEEGRPSAEAYDQVTDSFMTHDPVEVVSDVVDVPRFGPHHVWSNQLWGERIADRSTPWMWDRSLGNYRRARPEEWDR